MSELLTLTHKFLRQADLKPATADRLVELASALHEWNQKLNLTAAPSPRAILTDHLFDALTLAPIFAEHQGNAPGQRWADIGSGGGLPGLPLALALPEVEFTLIESIGKKCRAVEALIARLKLTNCRVVCARAETIGQAGDWRGTFAFATARALGPFSVQAELGLPLLAVGGLLLLQKSVRGQAEIEQARDVVALLGGEVSQIRRLEIPGFLTPRLVAVVRKKTATPAGYPRRLGVPARRPLA